MEKHIDGAYASRLDKCLALVRKCVIASKKSATFEAHVTVYLEMFDFSFGLKGKSESFDTHSLRPQYSFDFDESYAVLNIKVNKFLKTGVVPL